MIYSGSHDTTTRQFNKDVQIWPFIFGPNVITTFDNWKMESNDFFLLEQLRQCLDLQNDQKFHDKAPLDIIDKFSPTKSSSWHLQMECDTRCCKLNKYEHIIS